jgi:outer membrane protein TolC
MLCLVFVQAGCQTPSQYRQEADKVASDIITQKQQEALGKTEPFSIERPSDILRRRLRTEQQLLYSSEASLGTDQLDLVEHWPEDGYPQAGSSPDANIPIDANTPLKISLVDALQIGARNSDDYQSNKEDVFRAALDLDLERNDFRNIFRAQAQNLLTSDTSGNSTVTTVENSGVAGVTRTLENGIELGTALAIDLTNLLTQGGASSLGLTADTTISIPLLRGAGKHIVREPLTQAERNVVYAIWQFERFKRSFAVSVAQGYFAVLRQMDSVANSEENYRSAIASARWSRRQADAGRITQIDVDRATQRELEARNGWISAQAQYMNRLDAFKSSIGLPPDAHIELDPNDLEQLRERTSDMVKAVVEGTESETTQETPPADAPIELVLPSDEDVGPLEIDESLATQLALENRLDLRAAIGSVYDAQRQVVVRADALRADLTLGGTATFADDDDGSQSFDDARYTALLSLDLPIERTAERNAYRKSLINLEQATRDVQMLEDQTKVAIRTELRTLLESRESLKIQALSVVVAEKRVRSSTIFLEAGRIEILALLDAQDDLLSAQNSLTSAVINYRIAELALQRDMGLLQIDKSGLWREFSPEVINHVKQ